MSLNGDYEKKLYKKDLLISSYENKFKAINQEYAKFELGKSKLKEAINTLKENLILNEEKINDLNNCNLEKDTEINNLRNELYNQEERIVCLMDEISNLQNIIDLLNLELNSTKSKLNSSFISRLFNSK